MFSDGYSYKIALFVLFSIIFSILQNTVLIYSYSSSENTFKNNILSLTNTSLSKQVLNDIKYLSSIKDRLTGHNGYYNATIYLYNRLYNLTKGLVFLDNYTITIPVDRGSYLTFNGRDIKVYPIWPSGGVPVNINCSGRLVVINSLNDIDHVELKDSIVLAPISIDWKWLELLDPHIGVKAVLFYEDNSTVNSRMYEKYLDIPVNLPVGYISVYELSKKHGLSLRDLDGREASLKLGSKWVMRNVSNIVAYIPGENHEYKIVLLAHYDSWSPAIGYAPGAIDTLAPAYLLSIVEKLVKNRPRYDTVIVLFSGYYEGLVGERSFVEKYVFESNKLLFRNTSIDLGVDETLYIGIDINPNSIYIAPVSIGYYYTAQAIGITAGPLNIYSEFIQEAYSGSEIVDYVSKVFNKDYAEKIKQLFIYSVDPNSWWTLYPGPYWLDTEPFWSSGLPAFTLKTAYAMKGLRGTPNDHYIYLNFTNISIQYRLLDKLIEIIYDKKPSDLSNIISKGTSPNAPTRLSTSARNEMFAKLVGQVMVWVPKLGQRVPLDRAGLSKALVILRAGSRLKTTSPWNIRLVTFTDSKGYFEFDGIHTSRATSLEITALVLSSNGSVIALNAMGSVSRGSSLSISQPVLGSRTAPWEVWIVRYNGSISVNIVVDPVTYQIPLEGGKIGFKIVRTDNLAEPDYYYIALDDSGFFTVYVDRYRSYSIVFGPNPLYYVIKNALPGHIYSLYDALNDTLSIVEDRMNKLKHYRITSPAVEEFLVRGRWALDNATYYLGIGRYSSYQAYVLEGLTTAYNAYGLMKSTYLDIENTAILFSILLVLFAFIIGLYLRKPGDNPFKVIGKVIGITLLIAVIFAYLHPAFYLTVNAIMSIIGFIMILLSIPALLVLLGDFNKALREIKKKKVGIHEVERSRVATSYVAFSYGVEHMKRRRLRTTLTLTTLIVVVISVVLFTSMTSYIAPKPVVLSGYTPTRPQGFLFQREGIDRNLPMGSLLVNVVETSISNETVSRYWSPGSIHATLYSDPRRHYPLEGIVATEPNDNDILNISEYIVKGRWFKPGEKYVVIIPYSMIRDTDGVFDINKTIVLAGVEFKIIGAYDDRRVLSMIELDGQTFTPVIGFPRARALRVAVVPSTIVREDPWLGKGVSFILAQISSITRDDPYIIGKDVMYVLPALDTYVYSSGEGVSKYSRLIALQGAGFNYIVAPIVIASVSILGVMLGTIYERRREIYVYAALGLSPTQIGLMFIAEALAYALIAVVIGFTAGIVLTNIATTLLPGVFKPNYSSGYVVLALSATFLSVLLASIYPVFKASKMALPSLRRKWEFPTKPKGDEWIIPLPFKITSYRELLGAYMYVYEYISGFTSPDIGSFVVEKIGLEEKSIDNVKAIILGGEVRLKPWHAGVKQVFQIRALENKPGEWDISIYLKRLSGNTRIWVKSNKVFIDSLRKQLLLWRTLYIDDKKEYIKKALQYFKH